VPNQSIARGTTEFIRSLIMRLTDYDITTRYPATVTSTERISANESDAEVREILVEVQDPSFHVEVGQNIGVLAPGRQEIGQPIHFRLYSVADLPQRTPAGRLQFQICVRRCHYIDEFSGERFPGIASNYLCDLPIAGTLTITGPYGQPFEVPAHPKATLILICAGTGIAPFRGFMKHIHANAPNFQGRIWLFHGGQTGLDLLYRNHQRDDFSLYYDHDTFTAFNALSNRPGWSDNINWGSAIHDRGEELSRLLCEPETYVYVAGIEKILAELDDVLAEVAGSNQTWFDWKSNLQAEGRWIELVY
jgi:ferredoxin--NADP+ reductase